MTSTLKIALIPEKCIACGLCQLAAPEIFDYYDDGIVKFLGETDNLEKEFPANRADLLSAVRQCPTGAIIRQTAD